MPALQGHRTSARVARPFNESLGLRLQCSPCEITDLAGYVFGQERLA